MPWQPQQQPKQTGQGCGSHRMSDKMKVNTVDSTEATSRYRLTLWIPQGEPQDTGSVCGNHSINGNEKVNVVGTTAIETRDG